MGTTTAPTVARTALTAGSKAEPPYGAVAYTAIGYWGYGSEILPNVQHHAGLTKVPVLRKLEREP